MDDKTLLKAAQKGDANALIALYEKYKERVFAFAYYRLGRDVGLAEEVSAETFTRLASNLQTIKLHNNKPLLPWLYTVARNLITDQQRLNARFVNHEPSPRLPAQEPLPEAITTLAFDVERVLNVLEKLSDDQRDVLVLRFLQGYDVRETAEIMGKREGNIKTLTRRALRDVRRLLGESDA